MQIAYVIDKQKKQQKRKNLKNKMITSTLTAEIEKEMRLKTRCQGDYKVIQ